MFKRKLLNSIKKIVQKKSILKAPFPLFHSNFTQFPSSHLQQNSSGACTSELTFIPTTLSYQPTPNRASPPLN